MRPASPDEIEPGGTAFANHGGVVPMLWVLAAIGTGELIGLHLLLAMRFPTAAWVLSALNCLTLAWLILWIRSWKHRPHRLLPDRLVLTMGSLRQVNLPLDAIAGVSAVVSRDLLKDPGTRNLVPVAFPNRMVLLKEQGGPGGRTVRYAIRLDDPTAFDAALGAAVPGLMPPGQP